MRLKFFDLVSAHVTDWPLRPCDSALVGGGTATVASFIDSRRIAQQGMGLFGASIVGQQSKVWVWPDDIVVDAVRQLAGVGAVFDQVVAGGGVERA